MSGQTTNHDDPQAVRILQEIQKNMIIVNCGNRFSQISPEKWSEWGTQLDQLQNSTEGLRKGLVENALPAASENEIVQATALAFRALEVDAIGNAIWEKMKEKNLDQAPFNEALQHVYDVAEIYADLVFEALRYIAKAMLDHVPPDVIINTVGGICDLFEVGGEFADSLCLSLFDVDVGDAVEVITDSAAGDVVGAALGSAPGIGIGLGVYRIAAGSISVTRGLGNKVGGGCQRMFGTILGDDDRKQKGKYISKMGGAQLQKGIAKASSGVVSASTTFVGPAAIPAQIPLGMIEKRAQGKEEDAKNDLYLLNTDHSKRFKKVRDVDTFLKECREAGNERAKEIALGLTGQIPYPNLRFKHLSTSK